MTFLLTITWKTMFFNQELKIDVLHLSLLHLKHTTLSAKINHLKSALLIFLPITAVLIPTRHLPTQLLVRFGITGAFHALTKVWFWGEKSLGSINNSNRLFRKSVRTRRNRRRLSDSDFYCVFDANGCEKPWKHGVFGAPASAVKQIYCTHSATIQNGLYGR